jgi:hypothetical protein
MSGLDLGTARALRPDLAASHVACLDAGDGDVVGHCYAMYISAKSPEEAFQALSALLVAYYRLGNLEAVRRLYSLLAYRASLHGGVSLATSARTALKVWQTEGVRSLVRVGRESARRRLGYLR